MSGPSSYVRLFYHYTWATKGRLQVITPVIEQTVRRIAFHKAQELGFAILAIDGTEDHVHMVIRGTSTLSPESIVRHVKGASSHAINHLKGAAEEDA